MPVVYHDASGPIRLTHFRPMSRDHWRWVFMRPLVTLAGPQNTITGHTVECAGITAWTGCGLPSFDSRDDAERYATENGIPIESVFE